MSWVTDAAARLAIPRQEEFTTDRLVYPPPSRFGRCGRCGSTTWNLGQSPNEAAAALEVHTTFCRRAK